MDSSNTFALVVTLLLFSSFVKYATVLSVFRFGTGLVGLEFGFVCLVAAFGLAVVTIPAELKQTGFPGSLFSSVPDRIDLSQVTKALVPRMAASVDPAVAESLFGQEGRDRAKIQEDLSRLLPAFIFSELKLALTLGLLLLIPFVLVDLLTAHVVALVGMQQLPVPVVSMPLKILLFLAVDGWGMLAAKMMGGGGQ